MKKASSLKVGDTAIYIDVYDVKTSTVVDKPIDDRRTRPKFKIGRKDLANGEYIVNVATVYDSEEEAKAEAIKKLKEVIKHHTDEKLIAEGMLLVLNRKLMNLENEKKID